MSGIIGQAGSKSGVLGLLNKKSITSELLRSPDDIFPIPMQSVAPGTTEFYDHEMRAHCTGYSGFRSHLKLRYFEFECEIKGESSANHQGLFWGNSDGSNVQGGSSTGWRTCHQSSTNLSIRRCNQNDDQSTWNPPFGPNDNNYHHYKITSHVNGNLYVWIDGTLAHQGSFVPPDARYIGLVNFTGHVWFKNIKVRGWSMS